MQPLEQGERVIVRDKQGRRLVCRVWEDRGRSVLVCAEAEYRRTRRTGERPLAVQFPRRMLVEAHEATPV
jgi:hypothetical protein